MRRPADWNTDATPLCHRDRTKTLLAAAIEHYLTGQGRPPDRVGDSPWDVWWACYRAQRTAVELGLDPGGTAGRCEVCVTAAGRLAVQAPPAYPDRMPASDCSCLPDWARSMRQPMPGIAWPEWRLTVAMVKPGSDPAAVRVLLAKDHSVLAEFQRYSVLADVRRLYPDAYGRAYVARRDDYLTSAPVTVLVLLASPSTAGKTQNIKADIRRSLGDGDVIRNHLHMPDCPGDAFADLDHLAGTETFIQLYERHECDRAVQRLACYRTLLAQPDPRHRTG